MSARAEALAAIDGLPAQERFWLESCVPFRQRGKFRDLVANGRIDANSVLDNIALLPEVGRAHTQWMAARDQMTRFEVMTRAPQRPKLRVVS
ncbi:hypothetical protein [Nocardioides sp. Iso805N]|uniref:hypothetical protein n=1 Tax=Nocardioides sp. Iso805N TaxID=1283287 RepID=UPI00036B6377|nr:hypothetical protein [Nocardioides sp. Iso805N]